MKLVENARLRDYVHHRLVKKWSPQQISHRLIADLPHERQAREHENDLSSSLRACSWGTYM